MKPATASRSPHRLPLRSSPDLDWRSRSGALFAEFRRPAIVMVRRAFRGAFSHDELEDIYSAAWASTLRALAERHAELDDDEIRSYVFTAVASHAGKELRRRRRKPTAPLESDAPVADVSPGPDEQVAGVEDSQITRDLLASMPKRRRAVIMLRYGWGLEPSQVCSLIKGLSPRAYRKEITRGVDELAEKMRTFERGDWCAEREPVLKTFAAGLATDEQARQAKAHLAHCRDCSDFVARLSGHLHDLGGAVAVPIAIEDLDDRIGLGERLVDGAERARDTMAGFAYRGASGAEEAGAQVAAAGGARGAGVAGAGVVAKLAGIGTAGKVAVACVSGGVAATACVAAGIVPGFNVDKAARAPAVERKADHRAPRDQSAASPVPAPPGGLDAQVEAAQPDPVAQQPPGDGPVEAEPKPRDQAPAPAPVESTSPVAPETSAVQQEFGAPAAAAPVPSSSPAPAPAPSSASGTDSASSGSVVRQEFGP